jgi:hypothetical protein
MKTSDPIEILQQQKVKTLHDKVNGQVKISEVVFVVQLKGAT